MWSPRRLAELAGTSRRTVRYYDEIGLLPKPDRGSNGYGRYGVDHLVRLLRIRRLTELGLTLPQISAVVDADRPPDELMRGLAADLDEQIERMQQVRADVRVMLTQSGPFDLPAEVERRLTGLPSAERTLVVVLSRLLDAPAFSAYVALLEPYRNNPAVDAFDHLAPDAEPRVRAGIAQRLVRHLHDVRARYPDEVAMIDRDLRRGVTPKQQTVDEAIDQLYNPAQVDVLARLRVLHRGAQQQRIDPEARRTRQLAVSR